MTAMKELLSADEHAALARRLVEARDAGQGIDPPSFNLEYNFNDAYRVRRLVVDALIARGHRPVGHKIGFTAKAMQEMYGMTGPDFGQLLDYMDATDRDPVTVSDLADTRVEPEVAFVLARPLRGAACVEDVLDATAYVTAALEVIDSRVGSVRAAAVDSIADNAGAGLFILGQTHLGPSEVDLAAIYISMTVDGQTLTGEGRAVMDHPVNAVTWLANKLHEIDGLGGRLEAGDVVLSGSVTRSVEVHAGSRLSADYGPLGTIEVNFA